MTDSPREKINLELLQEIEEIFGDIDIDPEFLLAERKALQSSVKPPISRFQKTKYAGVTDEVDNLLKHSFGYLSKAPDSSDRKNALNPANEWDITRPDTALVNRVQSLHDRKQKSRAGLLLEQIPRVTQPSQSELVRKYGWMDNPESMKSHSPKQQTTVSVAEHRPTTAFPSQRNANTAFVTSESQKPAKRSIFQAAATNSFDSGYGSLFEPRTK